MAKPAAIQWLENETGEEIDYVPEAPGQDRQLSVRLAGELAPGLEAMAGERNLTCPSWCGSSPDTRWSGERKWRPSMRLPW